MRFEELSKVHQDFLMYCLSNYIKGKARKGKMDGIVFPSYGTAKVPGTTRLLSKLANEIKKNPNGEILRGSFFIHKI